MLRTRGVLAALALLVLLPAILAAAGGEMSARLRRIAAEGDNLAALGLVPLVAFFLHLALSQALRHDRLLRAGRAAEIRDAMID